MTRRSDVPGGMARGPAKVRAGLFWGLAWAGILLLPFWREAGALIVADPETALARVSAYHGVYWGLLALAVLSAPLWGRPVRHGLGPGLMAAALALAVQNALGRGLVGDRMIAADADPVILTTSVVAALPVVGGWLAAALVLAGAVSGRSHQDRRGAGLLTAGVYGVMALTLSVALEAVEARILFTVTASTVGMAVMLAVPSGIGDTDRGRWRAAIRVAIGGLVAVALAVSGQAVLLIGD